MSGLRGRKNHDPTRLVRVVNKIEGYCRSCRKSRCDPVQLVWMVKEIEGQNTVCSHQASLLRWFRVW